MAEARASMVCALDDVYRLIEKERKLLQADELDLAELESNLAIMDGLLKQLSLAEGEWTIGEEADPVPALRRRLAAVIALRQENVGILKARVNMMGTRITALKQEKAAHFAYASAMAAPVRRKRHH